MKSPLLHFLALGLSAATCFGAAAPTPTTEQLKSWATIRQQRVDLLRDEVKETDARIEARLDTIVGTLTTISDSKDSQTKVARMKEDTGKRLGKAVTYYDQKRAALKEELRNPRLQLTTEEKQKFIAAFDAKIEKRIQQILALNKSMPSHEDHEKYRATSSGEWGTQYERNTEYEQNARMTTKTNQQREAIVKQLDASIARLDRQGRALKTQISATSDPFQRKTLNDELAKTDALIAERRRQKLETLESPGVAVHQVALKQALDMDKALQVAINDLRRDFDLLFQRYNTFLNELSLLHTTEAALNAAQKRG
ncbi:MAG TPA: hypothetical protein VK961_18000 [Chthoniobacter sp.]|nr:hypothetical protein [Chthoniobacter sp.]